MQLIVKKYLEDPAPGTVSVFVVISRELLHRSRSTAELAGVRTVWGDLSHGDATTAGVETH